MECCLTAVRLCPNIVDVLYKIDTTPFGIGEERVLMCAEPYFGKRIKFHFISC
jgi:hypothetical protein